MCSSDLTLLRPDREDGVWQLHRSGHVRLGVWATHRQVPRRFRGGEAGVVNDAHARRRGADVGRPVGPRVATEADEAAGLGHVARRVAVRHAQVADANRVTGKVEGDPGVPCRESDRADVCGAALEGEGAARTRAPERAAHLHLAVERANVTLVEALLRRKAKPDTLDKTGWTPLHHAAAKDKVAVAKALIAGGANAKALSERGGTPLHEAAASGSAEMVNLFLNAGVDPAIVSKLGVTALDIAREFKNEAAIKILSALPPAKK